MATYDREANLIIRAQDLTSQPIGQVVERVKGLVTALDAQTKASLSGGASAQEFTKALTDLSKAADTLIKQKAALQDFGLKEDRLSSTKSVLDQRKAALEAARVSMPADRADQTVAQQRELAGLQRALNNAQRAADSASNAYAKADERMVKMGVDTFDTAGAHRTVSAALLEVTSAMAKATMADDAFTANKRRGAQYIEAFTHALKEHEAALAATERAEVEEARGAKAAAQERLKAAEAEMEFANRSKANVRQFDIAKTFQTADEERKAAAARMDSARAEAEEEDAIRTKISRERMTIARFEADEENASRDKQVSQQMARVKAEAEAQEKAARARMDVARYEAGQENEGRDRQAAKVLAVNERLDAQRRKALQEHMASVRLEADNEYDSREKLAARVQAINANLDNLRKKALQDQMEAVHREAEAENATRNRQAAEAEAINAKLNEQRKKALQDQLTLAHFEAGEEDKRRDGAIAAERFRQTAREANQRAAQADATAAAARAPVGAFGAGAAAREAVAGQFASIPGRFGDLGEIRDADAAIDKLNQTIQKGGVFSSSYSQSMQQVYSIQRRIAGDAGLIDRFKEQQKAASDAESAFLKARDNVNLFATQIQRAGAPTQELAKELQGAEREMASALKVTVAESQALEKLRAELKAASIDHTALGAATSKLTAQARRLAETQSSVQGKETGFLGLRPYQLKNLEYQIGDIYTQLSLGQGVLRTFNSQSDQIFQLFDISTSKLRLLATAILPAAAGIYVLVKALMQLKDAADAIREFDARLRATADGSIYNAKAMEGIAKAIQHAGTAAKDSRSAVEEFAKAGVNPQRFEELGKTVQGVVDVYGKKFPEALKEVTSAFTGGYEGLKKFDEEYNFLTASQRKHIETLFEEGKAEEARTVALDIFTNKIRGAARDALSDYTKIVRNLTEAWDEFLLALANTGALQFVARLIRDIANDLKLVTGQTTWDNFRRNIALIHDNAPAMTVDEEQKHALYDRRAVLQSRLEAAEKGRVIFDPAAGQPNRVVDQKEVAQLRGEIVKLDETLSELIKTTSLEAGGGAGGAGTAVTTGSASEAAGKRADAFVKKMDEELSRSTDRLLLGPARVARDAQQLKEFTDKLNLEAGNDKVSGSKVEEAISRRVTEFRRKQDEQRERDELAHADQIRAINQSLADQLIAIRNKIAQADKTNVAARLQAFDEEWSKMQSTIDKAKAHGATGPGGVSLADFQKTLEDARLQERQQIVLDGAQQIVTDTIKARKDAYGKIMDEFKGGLIDLTTAFKKTMEVTSEYGPKVADAVREARKALTEVPATPKTEAAGVSLGRQAATDTAGRTQTTGLLDEGMRQLREYYNVRRSITQNEKLLVQAGAESQVEAEKTIQKAYKDTQKEILDLIGKLELQANAAHDAGTMSDAAYLDFIGKLRLAKTETDYVSESQKQLKKAIEDSIVNHAVQAFDTIAQSLGNLIAGTGKWKDVLASIGQAFSQFAAGILRDIAAMIIKQELLMMIQGAMKAASTALGHGGDTVGLSMNMSRSGGAPISWASAPRMHSGGPVMGLASNEVPAVLEVGERVLSKGEARNYGKAMGAKSQGVMGVRNVLAVGDREIANAMAGAHGEKVMLSVLKRNAPTIRQWVRG